MAQTFLFVPSPVVDLSFDVKNDIHHLLAKTGSDMQSVIMRAMSSGHKAECHHFCDERIMSRDSNSSPTITIALHRLLCIELLSLVLANGSFVCSNHNCIVTAGIH
ncbi:hypothetical protein TNCV_4884801 [Trichonephila clavipes]|nr:hypothetical protein TNCV_4884801 [Trichonephila clavipes]